VDWKKEMRRRITHRKRSLGEKLATGYVNGGGFIHLNENHIRSNGNALYPNKYDNMKRVGENYK